MLDVFLEVVTEKTAQVEQNRRNVAILEKLPDHVLHKIASVGMPVAIKEGYGSDCSWLERFQGSPLLDQAIALEKEELEIQMAENERRRAESEMRNSLPTWDEEQGRRDELSIRKKLLELELAGGGSVDMGGQEGEDFEGEPPAPAAPKAPDVAQMQADRENAGADVDNPLTDPAEADGTPFAAMHEAPPAEAKPKTEKVTTKTTEKPVDDKEKIDIKAAAARMRFALAVKEAQPANRARAFQVKEAAAPPLPKGKGLGRAVELLTGSRARALGRSAASHNDEARNSFKQHFAGVGRSVEHEQNFLRAQKATRISHDAGQAERAAVGKVRKDVGLGLAGAAAAGTGAATIGRDKQAGVMDATKAVGSTVIRNTTKKTMEAAKSKPGLSVRSKVIGGLALGGAGAGLAARGGGEKTAALSPQEFERVKEAFGAALAAGLKGMGRFAQTAGKSIAGAAQAGGAGAAGQAAMNAGRSGLHRAGNFIAQNPGAGAALVAAPALAAGYAAG